MFNVDAMRELYQYMEWADSMVWSAVRVTPAAAADKRLREWLHHIHQVQRVFLLVWTGKPLASKKIDEFVDLAAIEAWGREYYPEAAAHMRDLSDGDLGRVLELPWSKRVANALGHEPAGSTLGETMFQIVNHTTHHRAQVSARLRELGGEPPLVDFIGWVWRGKPAPAWAVAPAGL